MAALDARVARLRAADVEPAPRALIYSNYGGGGTTPGAGTTYDLLLRLAGAVNVAAEAGLTGHVPLDHERLLALDPPILVVGAALDEPTRSLSQEHLAATPDLASLRALVEGRLILVPADLLHTTSHELVTAAEYLAPLLRAARGSAALER
ncbi:MAG: ABC transporter substrate-binding protein [Planctomycetota bacterium]